MHRSVLVPALLTAALLLTACDGGDVPRTASAAGAPGSTAAAPPAPGTAGAEEDTAAAVPDDGAAGASPAGNTPSPTTPSPGTPSAPAPVTPAPDTPDPDTPDPDTPGAHPAETVATHGASLWGVYLAAGDPVDPWADHALGEAESFLTWQGFTGSGIGSVACDQGAAEQLGLAPDANRLAVYFATADQARQFTDAYERDVLGTALVTTYCLD